MSKQFLALFVALLTAGGAAGQSGDIEISDAWARATPGRTNEGAVYVTLMSTEPDRLVGLSTPVADAAELHEMTMTGGIMRMRPLNGVDLPARIAVALKPGGAHIMLFQLHQPLRTGQTFPLTLRFEKAGTREVSVTVEKAGVTGPTKH